MKSIVLVVLAFLLFLDASGQTERKVLHQKQSLSKVQMSKNSTLILGLWVARRTGPNMVVFTGWRKFWCFFLSTFVFTGGRIEFDLFDEIIISSGILLHFLVSVFYILYRHPYSSLHAFRHFSLCLYHSFIPRSVIILLSEYLSENVSALVNFCIFVLRSRFEPSTVT